VLIVLINNSSFFSPTAFVNTFEHLSFEQKTFVPFVFFPSRVPEIQVYEKDKFHFRCYSFSAQMSIEDDFCSDLIPSRVLPTSFRFMGIWLFVFTLCQLTFYVLVPV
jgi:hypothetical protein